MIALLLAGLGIAWAQCERSIDAFELSVEGLGTAYFGQFRTDPAADVTVLFAGVCLAFPQSSMTVLADEVQLSGLAPGAELRLEMRDGVVIIPGWTLGAEELRATTERMELVDARFEGADLRGSAASVTIDLVTLEAELQEVVAQGSVFVLQGARATLRGPEVRVEDAVVTTCVCPGAPLYLVRSPEAAIDIDQQQVVLRHGVVEVSGVQVPLGDDLELTPEGLEDLVVPLSIEFRPDDPKTKTGGSGLGVVVEDLPVDDMISAEFGVVGLDRDFPLRAFLLFRARAADVAGTEVDFTVGMARGGPRADLEVRRALLPWLTAVVAFDNRHEPAAAFLHQGMLRLEAGERLPLTRLGLAGGGSLELRAATFAAASAQAKPDDPVIGARLGGSAGVTWRTPATAFGRGELATEVEATHYPAAGGRTPTTQFGVRLRPSWWSEFGPLRASVTFDLRATNAASPFSVALDRLEPKQLLSASVSVSGPLAASGEKQLAGNLSATARYSFLPDVGGGVEGLTRLAIDASLGLRMAGVEVTPSLTAELSGLLDPRPHDDRDARLGAGIDVAVSGGRFGVAGALALQPNLHWDRLEFSAEVTIRGEDLDLQPFVALDLLPLLRSGELPAVVGHGLELTWRSCCGTLVLGYRVTDDAVSTSVGVRFEP